MELPRDSVLLRIFVSEEDRAGHQPLYQAIVLKARERRLAGATVLRGPMGYRPLGPSAHQQDPAALRQPAADHRDRRQPGEYRRLPAGSGRADGQRQRPHHPHESEVVLYGVKEPSAAAPVRLRR